jgi:hypothetical protein
MVRSAPRAHCCGILALVSDFGYEFLAPQSGQGMDQLDAELSARWGELFVAKALRVESGHRLIWKSFRS